MITPFARAPHQGVGAPLGSGAHAALLIDFDNVTMGMRSDLSKDLKKLLQSDIIKGKVTVQRAYADWRRYPQYIVPLSEASIDLIFAPAYGSNKKNATDIRMAIDGMELVFTRPEIGTFILLTGDSDFSSLVLKLKEYGKYVIGVGIQESSSDILVQNCDEYYSYTSITGLRKTGDGERSAVDPWTLVERAVNRMSERDDVMRSDRLKQVMIEMDANFDEGDFGYSKFSRFLSEAASKNLVRLTKLENGQYEVGPAGGGRTESRRTEEARGGRGERGRRGRDRDRDRSGRPERGEREGRAERPDRSEPAAPEPVEPARSEASAAPAPADGAGPPVPSEPSTTPEGEVAPLSAAYDLLRRALVSLREAGRESIRDSDVKRKMLELDASFDETGLGFGKFSRFLRQAHDHEVVNLHKREGGNYEVTLGGTQPEAPVPETQEPFASVPASETQPRSAPQETSAPSALGPRRGSGRRRPDAGVPPLLEGQISAPAVGSGVPATVSAAPPNGVPTAPAEAGGIDAQSLGLPTLPDEQIRYLTGYRGVGKKTAEMLVASFGGTLFSVLQHEPHRVEGVVPASRAEQVLEAWREDYGRRVSELAPATSADSGPSAAEPAGEATEAGVEGSEASGEANGRRGSGRRRTRRGGRRGGRDRSS